MEARNRLGSVLLKPRSLDACDVPFSCVPQTQSSKMQPLGPTEGIGGLADQERDRDFAQVRRPKH